MKTTYAWTPRAHVGVPADVAGRELSRMAKGGEITARAVLDAARPEESPLHPAFEWDDAVAAELHREEQARLMLRSIRIVRDAEQEPERVFGTSHRDSTLRHHSPRDERARPANALMESA